MVKRKDSIRVECYENKWVEHDKCSKTYRNENKIIKIYQSDPSSTKLGRKRDEAPQGSLEGLEMIAFTLKGNIQIALCPKF